MAVTYEDASPEEITAVLMAVALGQSIPTGFALNFSWSPSVRKVIGEGETPAPVPAWLELMATDVDLAALGLIDRRNRVPALNMAYIGDSITEYADRYQKYAEIFSSYQIVNYHSAAFSGQSADQIADHIDDITDLDPKPDACLIVAGTNNAYNSFTLATYQDGITTMVDALRAANIVPIVSTVLPVTTKAAYVALYNEWLRGYAAAEKLTLVDLNRATVNPTNGEWKSGYADVDGVHPSYVGLSVMGRTIVDELAHLLTAPPIEVVQRTKGGPNAYDVGSSRDSFFLVDSTADGKADNFFGGTGTGVTLALEADPDGGGFNWQTVTVVGGSGATTLTSLSAALPVGWAVGDTVEFSILVDFDNMDSDSVIAVGFGCFNSGTNDFVPGSYINVAIIHGDVVGAIRYPRTILTNTTHFRWLLQYGPGDGVYKVALPTIRNLTVLGLA